MAFSGDTKLWQEFLQAWPIERLRTMTLPEYTTSGDKNSFVYWLEFRLEDFGSIAGGSAFKSAIFSRKSTKETAGDTALAYDANYGWYRRFGESPEAAFQAIRGHIVAIAEAARDGRLSDIDKSPIGVAYRWKIAFHYQSQQSPSIPCVFLRKPLLNFLRMPLSDSTTPQSTLYASLAVQRKPDESIIAFSERLWKDWVFSAPCVVKLSEGAVKNGYLAFSLVSAPFPEAMYGGNTDADPGETASFRTDTGFTFESDIRVQGGGGNGRLRKRLGGYFEAIGAKVGDLISVTQEPDGGYLLSSKGALTKPTSQSSNDTAGIAKPMPQTTTVTAYTPPLNQILFGPPGTGKTYHAIERALEILDPGFLANWGGDGEGDERRKALKARYDVLAKEGLVQFVTFHQSFSYEDFVEGIRAETDEATGQLRYEVADGVFKRICDSARTRVLREEQVPLDIAGRRIWKWSLGDYATEGHIYEECIDKGIALMGFGLSADFSQCKSSDDIQKVFASAGEDLGKSDYPIKAISTLVLQMKKGDLVVVTEGNLKFRAIGEIVGDYRRIPREDDNYVQSREVRWLRVYKPALPYDAVMENKFSQRTVYELHSGSIDLEKLRTLLKPVNEVAGTPSPRVLIIDEINRGNVSRIFGELITLVEPSKRAGAAEALEAVLPYSKQRFSVPQNVYLIGTMNTADRSLAGLDIALRRRFDFIEMAPESGKLAGVKVAGVELSTMLEVMNRRIELLLDRDHQLGHAYFIGLNNGDPLSRLASIFRSQILPLLQEYFFEDWQRIAWVLNDHRKGSGHRFVVPPPFGPDALFGPGVDVPPDVKLWRLDEQAFSRPESYLGIVDAGPG